MQNGRAKASASVTQVAISLIGTINGVEVDRESNIGPKTTIGMTSDNRLL